jgi:hypothetical protein
MKKNKFIWGAIIRPTLKCVKSSQMIKEDDYAISLGKRRNGELALVRMGHKTVEYWSSDYWELLPE